jgi:histone chaperone ASF1
MLMMQAEPPEPEKIPEEDIIGVTVLLLTCSYLGQEFIRVGYYVSNDYIDENLREEDDPPAKVQVHQVQRNILADKPRVTKFPIVFNPSNSIKTIDSIQPATPPIQNKAVDVEL